MEDNRDFLPVKLNNLKQQLPLISDELAKHLTMLPEELRHIPKKYDYEIYVKHGEKLIENQLNHMGQTELELGALLIVTRTIDGDEKWYETICRWGLTQRTAQIFMKNTRDFGDTPELIEGMGYRKTERIGSLPKEYLDQLKLNGRVLLPDGTDRTMTEFKAMTFKDLNNEVINIKNQYNKKIKKAESRAFAAEEELEATIKQAEEISEELEQTRKDANPSTAKQIKALEEMLTEKDKTIASILLEKQQREMGEFNEDELSEAIEIAEEAIKDIIYKYNSLEPGYYPKLGQKFASFFAWVREDMRAGYFTGDKFLEEPEREDKPDDNYDEDGYYEPPEL